ncbi:UDP-glycosyltransferase 85A2 [Camellia lanceoleosa]|uniref:UDP-glycosyltransferase 85A2 n=1 Tax=Camellia lanceoleosa TaxID=1840588 RepID=A0ACC0G0Z2_9ERIC|nr:UDP-glycosyltransferase 85A2 [Camellia lanceoleosa]
MESLATKKPHAIFIPFPAQGHGPNSVKDSPFFKFQTIPDGVPPSNPNATQSVTALLYYTQKHSLAPLRELIRKLNSLEDSPPVSVVISDGIMSFAIEVAEELGIPEFQFWTASSCGFMAYLQFVELRKRGIFPLKDENDITNGYLNTLLDWIPGMKNMRMKDMPSFVRSTNPNDIAFNRWLEEAQNNLKSHAIVFNAFSEFEHEVLEAITSTFPHIYTVGPLSLLCKSLPENEVNSRRSSLWKESNECTDWLDKQGPNSVVYVNFGSIVMSDKHLEEFAWGLRIAGMEIEHDVKREQVQDLVSKILEGEEGKKLRNKAMDWKKKAEAAVIEGGSSYNNFNLLVEELLQMSLNHCKQCG